MKFIPKGVTRLAGAQKLLAHQHSPQILLAAGIVGGVSATVLACKATLKLEAVLTDAEKDVIELKENGPFAIENANMDYTEHDFKKDMALLHLRHFQRIVGLYLPAAIVGTLSIAALTKSHQIMSKRNASLTLAYAAAVDAYDKYRQRVRDAIGDEREKEIHYGIRDHVIVEDTDKGPKKVTTKVATEPGLYARFYDEFAKNWQPDPELNRIFITNQERWANDKLHAQGYLFLNDVYERLGLEQSEAGQHVGWTLDGEGDGTVSFCMYDGKNNAAFINGFESSILLDFNVEGAIVRKVFNR